MDDLPHTERLEHDHIFQDKRASSPTCPACSALRGESPQARECERIVIPR